MAKGKCTTSSKVTGNKNPQVKSTNSSSNGGGMGSPTAKYGDVRSYSNGGGFD